jgi:hypothetical protein
MAICGALSTARVNLREPTKRLKGATNATQPGSAASRVAEGKGFEHIIRGCPRVERFSGMAKCRTAETESTCFLPCRDLQWLWHAAKRLGKNFGNGFGRTYLLAKCCPHARALVVVCLRNGLIVKLRDKPSTVRKVVRQGHPRAARRESDGAALSNLEQMRPAAAYGHTSAPAYSKS